MFNKTSWNVQQLILPMIVDIHNLAGLLLHEREGARLYVIYTFIGLFYQCFNQIPRQNLQ